MPKKGAAGKTPDPTPEATGATPPTEAGAPTVEETAPAAPVSFEDALKAAGVSEEAIGVLKNQEVTTLEAALGFKYDELVAMGVKAGSAKVIVAMAEKAAASAPAAAGAGAPAVTALSSLPVLPDDESWLTSLRTGGVLKPDESSVIAVIRAAIADRLGLFDMPDVILDRMEQFADQLEEPVGPEFWELQKLVTARNYGDVFAALNIPSISRTISEKRKREVLARMNNDMWPALKGFSGSLNQWVQTATQTPMNPAMLLGAIQGNTWLSQLMLRPPDTTAIRAQAEGVINKVNGVFAKFGLVVSAALASDAMRIRRILDTPNLPTQIGAVNKEQMLKMLGVGIGSDYILLEQAVARFALSIFRLPTLTPGNEELAFLSDLWVLSSSIDWSKLPEPTARPARRRRVEDPFSGGDET